MKKKRIIAFKEITFSKLIAMFVLLLFSGIIITSIILKCVKLQADISSELETIATMTGVILTGYFGKSGYEFYSRSRYNPSSMTPQEICEDSNEEGLQI